ncbi:MAG: class I SAM-dependent methyltransferase [Candidatus Sungbacteria bacterium]|nr:class I SAM-dependent methyltransferase [Candidatus Sungbacteria bacterium]
MEFEIQVDKNHYFNRKYLSRDRWANYWHQINAVLASKTDNILEIGVGNRLVYDTLKRLDLQVTSVDIDLELRPDVTGSVLNLPFKDNVFDFLLCAEVLEHLPWGDLPKALYEIRRVTQRFALITLPHSGYVFSFSLKIPLLKSASICLKIPHFWRRHVFNGEHYWELGKKSYSVVRVIREFQRAGFLVVKRSLYADDPAHYHFFLEKRL